MAATLATGGVLSHRSAGALWGVRPWNGRIEITVPRTKTKRQGLLLHRAVLAPDEITTHDGIPVTTPARTLTDLADVVAPSALRRALDEAEYHRLSGTPRPIPGRRGATRLGRALARHAADNPTRSALEAAFLDLLDRHGLPRPKVNAHLRTDLRLVEVDFLWPAERGVAQTDGHAGHSTRAAVERDRRTDAALHRAGFVTLRFTHHQVTREPRRTAQTVRALVYQTAREREESPLPPRIRSP
jgi:very-short-patch-repair endonuclease